MSHPPLLARIRELPTNMAIYGLGDVAISIVNFLLLGLYVKYLSAEDYGVLGLLGSVEVVAKIIFRFGLDGSFMRFFYDCQTEEERQRLASTIFFFLLAVNGAVLVVLLAATPALSRAMFSTAHQSTALRLVLLNTFAIGFTFIPFHVLRIERRSTTFSLLTLARSTLTVMLRLVLVVGFHMAVVGVVLADVFVTAALMVVLLRWFAPLIRPVFSRADLRKALAFGAPRVPHAAAQQVMAVADKPILTLFASMQDIGVYSMAVSFGLTQKLFLSAFESAWAPFYYATMREPDAGRVFRVVTTYGVAVLALLTVGLSVVGRDVAAAMTHGFFIAPDDPRWQAIGSIIAWTAVGVLLQGVYLLTSIGLNITKRTRVLSDRDHGCGRHQRRGQFPADSSLRDRRRGLGERGRVRRPGDSRCGLLAAVLSRRVRVGTPGARGALRRIGLCRGPIAAVDSTRARLRAIGAGASPRHPRSRHDGGRRLCRPAGRQRILSRRGAWHAARAPPRVGRADTRRDGSRHNGACR